LKAYKWTGHKELMVGRENRLINCNEVLSYFANIEKEAKCAYEKFVRNGLDDDNDFMGGGLVRSMGGIFSAPVIIGLG
jgi:hypothetical protein